METAVLQGGRWKVAGCLAAPCWLVCVPLSCSFLSSSATTEAPHVFHLYSVDPISTEYAPNTGGKHLVLPWSLRKPKKNTTEGNTSQQGAGRKPGTFHLATRRCPISHATPSVVVTRCRKLELPRQCQLPSYSPIPAFWVVYACVCCETELLLP